MLHQVFILLFQIMKSETYRKAVAFQSMSTKADCMPGSTRVTGLYKSSRLSVFVFPLG